MKTKITFISLMMIALLTSCVSSYYYQVYRAVPENNLSLQDDYLIYEDNNCRILYNFWDDNGKIYFLFQNKTENTLYLNLGESFFVINGIAHDYFQNRTFSNSDRTIFTSSNSYGSSKAYTGLNYLDLIQTNKINSSSSLGTSASKEFSTMYAEEKVIAIPHNSSKVISEFMINNSLYRDCDLFKYPTKKQIRTKTFNKDNSPIVFSNRLVYFSEKDQSPIKFENAFYVSEITNYAERDITRFEYEEFCKEKSSTSIKVFNEVSPDKFYLKYTKKDYMSH